MKRFYIRTANDAILSELEKLQNKIHLLESSMTNINTGRRKKTAKTAVYTTVNTMPTLFETEVEDTFIF